MKGSKKDYETWPLKRPEELTTRREAIKRMAALGLMASFPSIILSCGGSGGGGGGGGTPAPPMNVAGTWAVSDTVDNTKCPGGSITHDNYNVTVVQNGSNLTVTTPVGTFNGSINGNTLSWTGSFPEGGGTTTINSMTLTVSADGKSFSGSSAWTWTQGSTSCSGTSQSTGTLTSVGYSSAYSSGGYSSAYSSGYSSAYASYCRYGSGRYYTSARYYYTSGGYYSAYNYFSYASYGSAC